jgi:hypothetical protein
MLRRPLALLILWPCVSAADPAVISHASVQEHNSLYNFNVTVMHQDEGWDHYVDKWVIKSPSGEILATRKMHLPHDRSVGSFTRAYSGAELPKDIGYVLIQAHVTKSGWGLELSLPIERNALDE